MKSASILTNVLPIKRTWSAAVLWLLGAGMALQAQTLPMVGVHDSELTRALATMPAYGQTPTGPGTTGFEWWPTQWPYFVLPESVKEMLRSDGTAHAVVSDADISAGGLLTNGQPKYPIMISLAAEAIRDDEIAQLTNYVAAGGFLFVGSSSFTRDTNGAFRGNFAIADQMGVTMVWSRMDNWVPNTNIYRYSEHRLTAHLPYGTMYWDMPEEADEISWGISPDHDRLDPHDIWMVDPNGATELLYGDEERYLTVKQYGKGYFIYYAPFQPLIGHGGWAPGVYAYGLFRNAIEWAFESNQLPIAKLSPWPFAYDAAFAIRHDLENHQAHIADIVSSAEVEHELGARGDYYFCTGTLREEMQNTNAAIAGLRQAVTAYGATIGSHNGGLPNPVNTELEVSDYDYWHWGPDEVLDFTPLGYASGKDYAFASLSNSFVDIETWLAGINTGPRIYAGCYFNSTREDSYEILEGLQVKATGEQKLSPFPHWTLSTRTPNKRYGFVSIPTSEWYVVDPYTYQAHMAHSLDWFGAEAGGGHTTNSLYEAIDYYYNLGALINFYSHTLSTGYGYTDLLPEYISYSLNTNLHPRVWSANAQLLYDWWLQRSNAQVSASFTNTGLYQITTVQITGATSPNTAIEVMLPTTNALSGLEVLTNGLLAGSSAYRIKGQTLKVLVGTTISQVQIRLLTLGDTWFLDTFARENDPAATFPFVSHSGSWTISGGEMRGGPNPELSYGYVYYTNGVSDWTDYAVEARVKVPIGGFGGGVGGRLNPLTGAHYAAWLYPESTPGGAAQLRLVKFDTWTEFSYGSVPNAVMAEATLPSLGTNWHTLRLAFHGNQIAVFYDNARRISMTDSAGSPLTGGAITLDMYTDATPYALAVDEVKVTPLVVGDQYAVGANNTLTVAAPGVLGNDSPIGGAPTVTLAGDAQHGTLVLNSNGGFAYTPATNYTGNDTFIYRVSDGPVVVGSATVAINVEPLHNGPALPAQTNRTIVEMTTLIVTNTATDNDIPRPALTYSLLEGPTNATISGNGVISWTPVEAQGPGTNIFTIRVVDDYEQPLSATNTFTVVVTESNRPPVLPAQADRSAAMLRTMVVTNTAADPDIPANLVTYTLATAPTNAAISTNGVITWTPTEAQDGTTHEFVTVATDDGQPPLSYTNRFFATVGSAPVIALDSVQLAVEGCPPANGVIDSSETVTVLFYLKNVGLGDTVNLTATLLETNGVIAVGPPQTYGALLIGGPAVAQPFTFTAAGICGTNITARLRLQDGIRDLGMVSVPFTLGTTGVIMTQSFDGVTAPALPTGWVNINGGAQLPWITTTTTVDSAPNAAHARNATNVGTNVLVSPGIPIGLGPAQLTFRHQYDMEVPTSGNTKGYDGGVLEVKIGSGAWMDILAAGGSFVAHPYNRTIDTTYQSPIAGREAWSGNSSGYKTTTVNLPTNTAGQTIQLRWVCATDNGGVSGTGWRVDGISVSGRVCCANVAPILPAQTNRTLVEMASLVVTNTVVDTGIPVANLSYSLLGAPAGATITTNGIIAWTPTEAQGPSTNWITTVAVNNSLPPLSTTNSFMVTVLEVNSAPTLGAQTNRTVNELTAVSVLNAASDADLPANSFTYSLLQAPPSASISPAGSISWTPGEADSGTVFTFTTVVTDSGVPALSATNTFTVTVLEVNTAPALPAQANRTMAELTTLVVTNQATDGDLPPNTLTYALVNAPGNLVISAQGVITWTPAEAQGPSTNIITTVVTDDGTPPLSRTNSFVVEVQEINTVPVLPVQEPVFISGITPMVITNTALDSDVPVNALTYRLLAGPTNAAISAAGVITWTPLTNQVPSSHILTTSVTDTNPWAVNAKTLSATNTFTVTANAVHDGPRLSVQPNRTVTELTPLVVTNTATDYDLPVPVLTYSLVDAPAGATINSNGIITWTPSESQGPGDYEFLTVVIDNLVPRLSAANSFWVHVDEWNTAPIPPIQADVRSSGQATVIITNTAGDSDLPGNACAYLLLEAPGDALIGPDGVISWTPSLSQVPSTNRFVAVVTDDNPDAVNSKNLSATNEFQVIIDAVLAGPSLPTVSDRTINELTLLAVTNSALDGNVPSLGLNYSLAICPSGASIDTNGVITWTPTESQGPGTNLFRTVVLDGAVPPKGATNEFVVVVNEVNARPTLAAQAPRQVDEMTTLVVTNAASDEDLPANAISYSLVGAPAGALINADGVITWTPEEGQGPQAYTITTVATDNGTPPLSVTNAFEVAVSEVNRAPALPEQGPRTIVELSQLVVTNTAADPDMPANGLTYVLVAPPAGAVISTNGVITWTPSEVQGPATVVFTTIVQDDGLPSLSDTNSFTVTVTEANTPPLLPLQQARTINEQTPLVVTNTASDGDYPANQLSYMLLDPPPGASVDANGVVVWTPTEAQGPTNVILTTLVVDSGDPALGAVNSFSVTVREVNTAPTLPPQSDRVLIATQPLAVTNAASDADLPVNPVSYVLAQAPAGATISPQGVVTWTPAAWQVPSTNLFVTVATDTNATAVNAQQLSATNAFTVYVNATHNGPSLPPQQEVSVLEGSPLVVTNTGTSEDIPALALFYQLIDPPAGASIDTNGIIRWTPLESQGPSTNVITTVVTDAGSPPKQATNSFVVRVAEWNSAPVLLAQADRVNEGLTPMTVTNTASDADLPVNALTYVLAQAPAGAAISADGVITWAPSPDQAQQAHLFRTVVTDYNPLAATNQALSATNSFTVTITPAHNGPRLPDQPNYVIDEGTVLMVSNTAANYDMPSTLLSYQLIGSLANCSIDANGIITFAPSELQGNTTNRITTYVCDDAPEDVLWDLKSFYVTVRESNSAPVLPPQADRILHEPQSLVVSNTATDADVPANPLTYTLLAAPAGAAISPNGIITWTPAPAQIPSTNVFITRVTDTNAGAWLHPQRSATNSFTVIVTAFVAEPPVMLSINRQGTTCTVRWSSVAGQLYQLQYKNALSDPQWNNAGPVIEAGGAITEAIDNVGGAPRRFYRVVLLRESLIGSGLVAQPPAIVSVSQGGTAALVRWSSLAGQRYQVQYKNALSEAEWTNAGPVVVAGGSTTETIDNAGGAPQRFYRVVLLRDP